MWAWFKRQALRLLLWIVSVPMPNAPQQQNEQPLRGSKRTKTAAQLKREARKRRNIEKRKPKWHAE